MPWGERERRRRKRGGRVASGDGRKARAEQVCGEGAVAEHAAEQQPRIVMANVDTAAISMHATPQRDVMLRCAGTSTLRLLEQPQNVYCNNHNRNVSSLFRYLPFASGHCQTIKDQESPESPRKNNKSARTAE